MTTKTTKTTRRPTTRCPVCERPVVQRSQRGRPAVYCYPAPGQKVSPCKALTDRFTMLRAAISGEGPDQIKFSKTAAAQWRAEIWALGNDVKVYVDVAARQRFADAVRNGRDALGLSQKQLAAATGITRRRVSAIENADADVTGAERRALLDVVTAGVE